MSFVKLSKELFEHTTIKLHPDVHFISSSLGEGVTGSMFVAPTRTNSLKETFDYSKHRTNNSSEHRHNPYTENGYGVEEYNLQETTSDTISGLSVDKENYMTEVNNAPVLSKFSKKININRVVPTTTYTLNTSIKNCIRKNLQHEYINRYPDLGFHYTNYHTINFFDSDNLPSDSCLMYGNYNNRYIPTSSFSIDFWINPRYDNFSQDKHYNAGTILHSSSSIALSLISGSQTDKNGLVSSFKLLLQLSQSADVKPSSINFDSFNNSYPNNLIFTSSNELTKNHWHHVTVRWGPNQNNSTGSMIIDNTSTKFYVPSSSLFTNNHALVVGNFFNANNDELKKYFNSAKQTKEGNTALEGAGSLEPNNQGSQLSNPAQAELHDIKIFNKYLNTFEIDYLKSNGINNKKILFSEVQNLYDKLIFYLPPYFIPDSLFRNVVVSPYHELRSKTHLPFNRHFSFRMMNRVINLENFVADLSSPKRPVWPRLQSLTSSVLPQKFSTLSGDSFIYSEEHGSPQVRKRNLTILPNDNGLFKPDYYPLTASFHSGSLAYKQFGSGSVDVSKISLVNMLPRSAFASRYVADSGRIYGELVGLDPNNNPVSIGQYFPVAQATKDISSNEITIFDISNLFYGNQIKEESIEIIDHNVTGSEKRIKIAMKDNGAGSLYRADALTPHAKWNNVGDVFYHEGLLNVLSPHLPHFCKDKVDIKLQGDQNIHTMILNIPFFKSQFNSSSNPTFKSSSPTSNINDDHLSSIYVTAVNIHDDNFNIIMKAHFAQPILKTEEDEFIVRLKQDF